MKKFNISAFCAKKSDPVPSKFWGISYKDGKMIASNTLVLASVKADYPAEYEGGIYAGDVRIFDETIPAEMVLEQGRAKTLAVSLPIAELKAACKVCRDSGKAMGAVEFVAIPFGDNQKLLFKRTLLSKILTACECFGIKEMHISESRPYSSAYLTDGNGNEFAIRPAYPAFAYVDLSGRIHDYPFLIDDLIRQAEIALKDAGKPQEQAKAASHLISLKFIKSRLA